MTSTAVALATPSDINLPVIAQERGIEAHQWNALKNAVFKGASDQMILMAVDYCRSRQLDPLKKPVHIVKTWDTDAGKMIETIWEGIASHRTTASRAGGYAGQDEPVFGPDKTEKLGGSEATYPEWCKVTVYRVVAGQRCAFVGLVWWKEAYAKKKGGEPNAMWTKRPRGQVAKCAEAEALRKAFPEEIGGRPTAEEMDGQAIGFENAKDVTPRTADRPANKLDALNEVAGDEPQDAEIEEPPAPQDGPSEMDDGFPGDRPSYAVPLGKKDNGKPDYSAWLLAVADRIKAAQDTDTLNRLADANGDILSDIRGLGPTGQKNHKWLSDVFDARYDELGGVTPKDADTLGAA